MNKDLTGFEKSAPSGHPLTRGQKTVSAWDVDLSPFHDLVDRQVSTTQQMIHEFSSKIDVFFAKIDKLIENVSEADRGDKSSIHEKILHTQKKQVNENTEIRKSLLDIGEQFIEIRHLLQEMMEKYNKHLENIQHNTQEVVRPILAQENLIREGFSPSQIIAPLDRLIVLEENSLNQLQSMVGLCQQVNHLQGNVQKNYAQIFEQIAYLAAKLNNIENLLIPVGAVCQSGTLEKNFVEEQFDRLSKKQNEQMGRVIHYCERMANCMENFDHTVQSLKKTNELGNESLRKQQELAEREYFYKKYETIVFWLFVVVVLVVFFWVMSH